MQIANMHLKIDSGEAVFLLNFIFSPNNSFGNNNDDYGKEEAGEDKEEEKEKE